MFRKSTEQDVDKIMKIIKEAQEFFKKYNIDQWQNNYPTEETIKNDILNGYSYVYLEEEEIVATAAISFDGEETYEQIYHGNWLTKGEFAVVHRIAVANIYKGRAISSKILENVEIMCAQKGVKSIKVDTHEKNMAMQKVLKKSGFSYRGIIHLKEGSERLAFEKIIRKN